LTPLDHVKSIIAVASGKGGVGKSTTSVNLALALARRGKKVGVLDADIYGPSLPRMLGLAGQPEIREGKMIPLRSHGLDCMSMGFITGDEAAILRGPMISKALQQMLRMTRWGTPEEPMDVLIVDMPPGTGDIHLSMVQQVPLTGAVIVTTPQEVATIDAKKCLSMFQKVNVPVLGVVENMSYFVDATGARVALFGEGGGKKLATGAAVPFLGDVAIDVAIGQAGEQGAAYAGACLAAYDAIAGKL
jgi:ATP-binding protein involved in chromosome partitioning